MKNWRTIALLCALCGLSACGYNRFQSRDEEIKATWAEVLNQYQRRADLDYCWSWWSNSSFLTRARVSSSMLRLVAIRSATMPVRNI